MVNHFLSSLSESLPVIVLKGHCLKNPPSPYYPFLEAFCDTDKNESNLDWLKRAGQGQSSGLSSQTFKDEAFGSIRAILSSMCAKKSVILFIEDIHWSDSGSLELLACLAEPMPAKNLFVIATLDDGNVSQLQDEKFSKVMGTIRKSPSFQEIRLSGLNLNEISSLLNKVTSQTSQPIVEGFFEKSHGNPLYIIATLKLLSSKQSPEKAQLNIAQLVNEQKELNQIVISIANKLLSEQRKILDIASVLSTEFDLALIAKILSISIIEVLETVNAISESSSLIVSDGTKYCFCHEKFHEILYEAVAAQKREEYHGKIAMALEKESDPKPWQLAYHYRKSNNKENAIKYSLASGEQALSFMLDTEAAQFFSYVQDMVKDNPQYLIQREKATESLGDALLISGDLQAGRIFEQLSEQSNSNQTKVRALRKACYASLLEGNQTRAFALIRKTLNISDIDQLEIGHFYLLKGAVEAWGGNITESLQDLEKALSIFEDDQSSPDVIDTLVELSIAYMGRSKDNSKSTQSEKSLACITRALALSEKLKDKNKQAYALETAFTIFFECGLWTQAKEVMDRLSRLTLSMNDPQSRHLSEAWSYWMSSFMVESNAMDKIFTKIFDKIEFCPEPKIEVTNDSKQEFRSAIEYCQKGIKLVEDKYLLEIRGLLYGNFSREYCFLGELQSSDEFLNRLEAINFTAHSRLVLTKSLYLFSKALSCSFKRQWQDANRFYKESIDYYSNLRPGTSIEATIRQWYGCALLQQKKFEDGMQQLAQSKSILREIEKRVSHANILASLSMPSKVFTETDFTLKIEIANVGKNPAVLCQVKNLIPSSFEITSSTPILKIKDSIAEMENKQLDAYKAGTEIEVTGKIGALAGMPVIEPTSIRQLAEDFARYIYLPRLQKPSVLVDAVREGIALLSWSKDAFAYAESYDEESRRYRGLRFAQQVVISEDGLFGLLVKPEAALKQYQAEKSVIEGPAATEREISGGRLEMAGEARATVETAAQPSQPKRFHGSVKLDPTRVGRDAGRVADEVIAHLAGLVGSSVTVTLEIEANVTSGTPENVVRTVTENCRTLKFTSHGFEKE